MDCYEIRYIEYIHSSQSPADFIDFSFSSIIMSRSRLAPVFKGIHGSQQLHRTDIGDPLCGRHMWFSGKIFLLILDGLLRNLVHPFV